MVVCGLWSSVGGLTHQSIIAIARGLKCCPDSLIWLLQSFYHLGLLDSRCPLFIHIVTLLDLSVTLLDLLSSSTSSQFLDQTEFIW
ncbi:unnamed protein product [Caenorhabditis angaria]|uniref:Uncharacterized protein n=1 Tax=Caenorhabditis angaria TaxID=860376 RepID=A0A9P1J4F8_9PELO|nr:unnamed protein product [Caenorhabditis angaria]